MKQRRIKRGGLKCRAIFFLVALCLNIFIPVAAQQFKAGILGGIATTQVDGDTYSGYGKAGIFAGAFVTKQFLPSGKWSASFAITYLQKGSRKIPHPDKGDYADYLLKLDYAEVPLLVQYDFAVSDSAGEHKMNFALFGGIALGALVRSAEWEPVCPCN